MTDVVAWTALIATILDLGTRGWIALRARRREAARRRGYMNPPPPPGVIVKKIREPSERPWDGL